MKKYFVIIVILTIGVLGGVFLPRDFGSKKEILFQVEKSQGSREIALNLERERLIWWGPIFRAYVLLEGMAGKLQAGYYFLSPSMNIPQIAEKLVSGNIAEIKITIPEGFTSQQIYERLQNKMRPDLASLEKYEGYLFPDTYYIPYGATQPEIIKMMKDNFDKKTEDLKVTSKIVIMASLLEKEVKTEREKKLAADILWKRLEIGVPLQVDACTWTYKNLGLPSKPICNPGLESILAALYPEPSQYWYYLSKPDGKTIFQKTLEEHNIAKAKYLK